MLISWSPIPTFCGVLMLLIAGGAVLGDSDGVPEEFQQMFDQGQYQPLLPRLNAAISKTTKSDGAQRYSLLMLKGETLLRLKASGSAEDAFHSAALVGPDADSIAIANATFILLKHSGISSYQPKTKQGDSAAIDPPIDILDKTSRKDAFSALFTDQLAAVKPQVEAIDNVTSLPPIILLVGKVKNIRDIEIASIGSAPQSRDMLGNLSNRAASLMTDALKPMTAEVDAVASDAAKRQKDGGYKVLKDDPSSLSLEDIAQLRNLVNQARQISNAAGQMQPIFGDTADFKPIPEAADKIISSANKILTQYKHPAD